MVKISHVVSSIAWVAFTVHVLRTNEKSSPSMNDQRETAAVATEKNVEFSKESADPYVQDVVLIFIPFTLFLSGKL